jgi:tRNA(Ile2) C34 agmatinyltransferase TiaS
MTTRSAVLRRVVAGALVMVVLGVASSMIDPRPHLAPLTYYVRLVDLAALLAWGVYVYRTPCARCGKPIGWRGLDRTGDFKCPHCGADSGSEFPDR